MILVTKGSWIKWFIVCRCGSRRAGLIPEDAPTTISRFNTDTSKVRQDWMKRVLKMAKTPDDWSCFALAFDLAVAAAFLIGEWREEGVITATRKTRYRVRNSTSVFSST